MGKIKSGILGGVKGKIGNVVGSSWKGIDYLKTLPASYSDAKTETQVNNRSKFLTVVRFLQPLTEVLRVGYKSLAVKKSAFNAATSYHYKNAIMGEYPDVSMDYSKVMMSKGNLRGADNALASSSAATKLNLSWTDNTGLSSANADDVAIVVVYHPELGDAFHTLNAASRGDLAAELDLPQSYSGSDVHVYLSFMALSGTKQTSQSMSNSSYLGLVSIL